MNAHQPPQTATTNSGVVQLNYAQKDQTVTVTPENEDRFAIRVEEAILACQLAQKEQLFRRQLDHLWKVLAAWLHRRDDVSKAYFAYRDRGWNFIVIKQSVEYNPVLDDQLSELDLALHRDVDLDLIRIEVMALPPVSDEALQSFVDKKKGAFLLVEKATEP